MSVLNQNPFHEVVASGNLNERFSIPFDFGNRVDERLIVSINGSTINPAGYTISEDINGAWGFVFNAGFAPSADDTVRAERLTDIDQDIDAIEGSKLTERQIVGMSDKITRILQERLTDVETLLDTTTFFQGLFYSANLLAAGTENAQISAYNTAQNRIAKSIRKLNNGVLASFTALADIGFYYPFVLLDSSVFTNLRIYDNNDQTDNYWKRGDDLDINEVTYQFWYREYPLQEGVNEKFIFKALD